MCSFTGEKPLFKTLRVRFIKKASSCIFDMYLFHFFEVKKELVQVIFVPLTFQPYEIL